ncbi:MAG: barstar family protein, partial [Candidatus Gracilibacteria bacterium]|nr:barstar family protein [Candidatus Gracilibacteria bacterium]
MINNSIIMPLKDDDHIKNIIKNYNENDFIHLNFDGKNLPTANEFLKKFYRDIGCPDSFGKNWDAFWDTITDE